MSPTTALPAPVSDEHAARLVSTVTSWYAGQARDLPWRDGRASPWGVLVSEVMLQQTPVVRVAPAWAAWMRRWPTPTALADADPADVLHQWDRLGYPRRALRLQECAHVIRDRHDGQVPTDPAALRELPGVGEYTTAAVTAFAHGGRALVIDTNIRRVLVRVLAGKAQPGPATTARQRQLAEAVLPAGTASSVAWNQAVMELGALVCTARSPRCEQCPVAGTDCAWFAAGKPADEGPRPPAQRFEGTDRQMRGRIMALLRRSHASAPTDPGAGVEHAALLDLDPEDAPRVERCLNGLLADGLARRTSAGLLRLP